MQDSRPSVWRCGKAPGTRFRAVEEPERQGANALLEQWEPPSRAEVDELTTAAGYFHANKSCMNYIDRDA